MFVERQFSSSALFTLLVGWHARDVSLPPGDVILVQLACPLNTTIRNNLNIYLQTYIRPTFDNGIKLECLSLASLSSLVISLGWYIISKNHNGASKYSPMRLCQPPDGNTSPKYKLLCFITIKFFLQREERTSF